MIRKLIFSFWAVLLVANVSLWVRSHFAFDLVQWEGARSGIYLESCDGKIGLVTGEIGFGAGWRYETASIEKSETIWYLWGQRIWKFLGASIGRGDLANYQEGPYPPHPYWWVAVPYWMLTLLTAVPLAWMVVRSRRAAALGRTLCRQCQYDLRAHQAGGKCPECGTVIQ